MRPFLFCMFLVLFSLPAFATLEPVELMKDPALEQRARVLYDHLRCPVCEGQSIAESNADVARAMRALVREELRNGKTNNDVLVLMQTRYGNTVLLKPDVSPLTWMLWFMPLLALMSGGFLVARQFRKKT